MKINAKHCRAAWHQVAFVPTREIAAGVVLQQRVRWPAMPGLLLRKTATLVVAYSIALQVLLSGLVVGGHASFDPFAAICGSDGAGDHHAPPPQLTAAAPWCVHRLFAARPTPMSFTLAQAAAACGDRTARRMVDLSNDAGVWHVEPVELHRIFPPAPRPDVALAASSSQTCEPTGTRGATRRNGSRCRSRSRSWSR
jgi:hypothetical protein